jgi:glycosyltransferase involved in cell wall biosynthesis
MNPSRKKIGLFCHSLEINGANNFSYDLVSGLQSNYAFTVLSPKDGALRSKYEARGISVIIGSGSAESLVTYLKDFDEIIVNTLMMAAVVLAAQERKVKHSLVIHETWDPDNIEYWVNQVWKIPNLNPSQIKNALLLAEKVVFPAKYLSATYEPLVEAHRTQVIYCSVDVDAISNFKKANCRKATRQLLGLTNCGCVFLQVGTVTRRKAQLNTVKAFHQVLSKLEDSHLLLVGARSFRPGEKEYIEEIENYLSANGIDTKVSIVPVRKDIYPFFMAADILVHPSINEVLPIAILEACAFELPIIASELDGIPEVIEHKKQGLLVNPFDLKSLVSAMELLATDSPMRQQFGKAGLEKVADQHAVDSFVANYNKLLAS